MSRESQLPSGLLGGLVGVPSAAAGGSGKGTKADLSFKSYAVFPLSSDLVDVIY